LPHLSTHEVASRLPWVPGLRQMAWGTLLVFILAPRASAQAPSGSQAESQRAMQESLLKTQQMLTNPQQRQQAIAGDKKAQETDKKVQNLLGPDQEKAYEISAQVLQVLVDRSNGDPAQMQNLMNQLMANPALLEQYLTPENRQKITEMGKRIEAEKSLTQPNPLKP
jgi:hypothetical protein